jgi:group II intron reverse transcriptase/maturase
MLEEILGADNMREAYRRVVRNKGSHGVDGRRVDELRTYLVHAWPRLKASLLDGSYEVQPVMRVEIPKPDGGVRMLGIPTVVDRMIQQAIAQKLSKLYESEFSESSYGFRTGKSAHQAVRKAREYIEEGYTHVVDIDLEKFFDRVNHDKLMGRLAEKVKDKRVLKLIRNYLEAGAMSEGRWMATEEGTPQGGNLSPLLSNILLDELDRELHRRGHRFCRYADDCNVYVKSHTAGKRVMESICRFIETRLKLKVNNAKSAVARPWERKFLGFTFYRNDKRTGIRIHPKSVKRLTDKIREELNRNRSISMEERLERLSKITVGWVRYFGLAQAKEVIRRIDEWMRRRIRACFWKQWKRISTKFRNLVSLGIKPEKAWEWANSRKKYWRIAGSHILATTLTNRYLESIGFVSLNSVYNNLDYSC